VPTNRNVASPMQGVNVALVDPAMTMRERGEWNRTFNQIFLHASES
jgi:iron(III) transport system substrate-binding protein